MAEAFSENNLTSVVLGSGIVNIGAQAFKNNALETLRIPDSVVTISEGAFNGNNLISVVLGSNVTQIRAKCLSR